ncbi:family 16 glycosylhydrolase [Coraliomargarita akajimensis]|uniref:family 16 glycosylhydrolase n=1 Tax=Coraliomargarita akajimensis TaxID=395922 RepID=UPI00145D2DBB|nr:family 16 glycosylhydrolase [Coraliomargarita akajimensis]
MSKLVVLAVVLFLTCISNSMLMAAPPGTGWRVVWSDEFNGSSVDTNRWKMKDGEDWQAPTWIYPENCTVSGGHLRIKQTWRSSPGPHGELYTGGWLESKKTWNKGYFEARTRLQWHRDEFWPAFWMWAGHGTDEFDIMEWQQYWGKGINQTHFFDDHNGRSDGVTNTPINEWHTFGVLWTDNEVTFYIDGVKQYSSANPASARADWLPIILSTSPNKHMLPARSGSYPDFMCDWVRVWQGGNPYGGGGSAAPIGSTIALKANGNGKYLCADQYLDAVNWPVAANRNGIGAWEKFTVVDAGGGMVAFKSVGNGKYLCADKGLGDKLAANRTAIGAWEKFTWVQQSDGTVAIKANSNGKYLSSDKYLNATNWPVAANRAAVGAWEKFSSQQQ